MSEVKDQIAERAGTLWAAVVEQAKKDLILRSGKKAKPYEVLWNDRLALAAAMYFFLEPAYGDDSDMRTFAGLCAVIRVNVDAAAKAIFEALQPEQQKRILDLLRNAGYEGIRTEVVM